MFEIRRYRHKGVIALSDPTMETRLVFPLYSNQVLKPRQVYTYKCQPDILFYYRVCRLPYSSVVARIKRRMTDDFLLVHVWD